MVNIYKLTNLLEAGMTIFQLNQWKEEGIWYPITQYKKPSNEIEVVTNLFVADQEQYHIQLSGKYNASLLAHRELSIILYSISTGIHIHNR